MHTQHSFGGRALDRYTLDFETEIGGGEDAPVVEAAADAAPGLEASAEVTDTGAGAPSTAEPPAAAPTPAAPTVTPEEYQALVSYVQTLEQRVTEATAPAEPAVAPPTMPHVLDEDYEERMVAYLEHRDAERDRQWQERFDRIEKPARTFEQQQAAAQKDAIIDAIAVEGFDKADPEFREGAEFFAVGMIDAVKAELGLDPSQPSARAAEVALQRGAEKFTAFAKAQRDAGKTAYIAELEALRTAETTTPGVTAGGVTGAADVEDEQEAVRRILARAQ